MPQPSAAAFDHKTWGLKMRVHFGQIYIEPGITFPFSHHFQRRLAEEITALVKPSETFTKKFGADWELMFRISAKTQIDENEIRGPTIYKRDKNVEYTVFLPFDVIAHEDHVPQMALLFLLKGCCHVFRELGVDPAMIEKSAESMIDTICADPKMFV
jgi:hypothetical protein